MSKSSSKPVFVLKNNKTEECAIFWEGGTCFVKEFDNAGSALIWGAGNGYPSPEWEAIEE